MGRFLRWTSSRDGVDFPPMVARVAGILLMFASIALGEVGRIAVESPETGLARMGRDVAGPGTGNQLFYLPTRDESATPATWGCKYENVNF